MGKTQLKLAMVKMTAVRMTAVAMAAMLAACSGRGDIGEATYGADQCRRIALHDRASGAPIIGAEDFALDAGQRTLFISAYDRRAVEKAARKKAMRIPAGGLYAIPVARLFEDGGDASLEVASMVGAADIAGGLRPHGLAYDAGAQELIFINRGYHKIGNSWNMLPRLQRVSADMVSVDDKAYIGEAAPAPCSANGVLTTEHQVFTTFDHNACDWRAGIEDVFNLKESGLSISGVGRVYDSAGFANGLARTKGGDIVMAATRENTLIVLNERSGSVEEVKRIETPGGPDNLTIAHDGGIVAAAHPSLWRLALTRKLGIGKAPTRIVKSVEGREGVEILFDDPSGALFSAATVAVETADGLIAGSVADEGLLVCRKAS